MIDIDNELYEMKRAVAHLGLGFKAYRAAERDQIDASRLLESISNEIDKLIASAEAARQKTSAVLESPVTVEG